MQATEEEIRRFCRGEIAHFKVPRFVMFVESIPLTTSGKIQKYVLREQMAAVLEKDSRGYAERQAANQA